MAALSVGVELIGDGLDESVFDPSQPRRGVAPLARRLEAAGVTYWVIGAERGEPTDPTTVALDPSVLATVAARHTAELGLVVAAAPHRDHPYNLARRLVSVDHAARGRVGWLALDFDHAIGLNAASDTWTGAVPDPVHTAHAVNAVRTLWRTWPLASIVGDRATGMFADVNQIRRADVRNGYAITGPLNVPGSRQGDLPVWRLDAGDDTSSSSNGADLVIVEAGARIPAGVPVVVRVRSTESIAATLDRLAGTSGVVGVILRLDPDAVDDVLDVVLPAAHRRGLLQSPHGDTLRARLDLPPLAAPEMSGHALAFDGAPNPGGRL
ncbi:MULTISPECIES: LLM class flavin-dependent oxidoreductase [unclassified Mycobacterium]|uniref:LLM class flavin-dependent oxidoreductase n=1 Tax=unclassified Mycobacterium TaxID=2642494 RepID=UPI0029C80521|nr:MULTISPECIES: LLM class flavin-dependent oxidoreductase [unclassified Mycobacterium]